MRETLVVGAEPLLQGPSLPEVRACCGPVASLNVLLQVR